MLSKQPHQQRLQMHRGDACAILSKQMLYTHFKRYSSSSNRNDDTEDSNLTLEFRDFAQALSHYREQGQPFPLKSTVEKLWHACSKGNIKVLIDNILYAPPEKQLVNQFGFGKTLSNPLQRNGALVENGPFVYPDPRKAAALKALEANNTDKDGVPVMTSFCPNGIKEMPNRLRYRHSKTPVQPPAAFDTNLIALSAQKPSSSLSLEHIYGYTVDREVIPGPNSCPALQGKAVFYAAAAVGIIHDIETNRQKFLRGHTDDISALAVDNSGRIAATGQMGKKPWVNVWDLETASLVGKLGEGFFARLVCCIAISPDGKKLVAVSGDDHHMLGIWSLITLTLEAELPAQNGPPPQVVSIRWLPYADNQFVTVGSNHIKVWTVSYEIAETSSDKNRLRRASLSSTSSSLPPLNITSINTSTKASLNCRAAVYGKVSKQAKLMPCVSAMLGAQVLVTGGDNGYVYIWRESERRSTTQQRQQGATAAAPLYTCVLSFFAHKGGVKALLTEDSRWIISGGADGQLKQWDLSSIMTKTSSSDRIEPTKSWDVCSNKASTSTLTTHMEARASPFPKDPNFKSIISQMREMNQTRITSLGQLKGSVITVGLESSRLVTFDLSKPGDDVREIQQGHHKNLSGLAVHPTQPSVFATAGEDGLLFIIDATRRTIISRLMLPARARSLAFSPDGTHLAVGFDGGAMAVYEVNSPSSSSPLREIKLRRDCKEAIDELKYSPNGRYLAVGSHDNYIDLYETKGYEHRRRLKGHTSYITHLDWSQDSSVIQSNCGAYEIIYWDAKTGSMLRSTRDSVEANTQWATWTCVLGFPVMGIWPPNSDGTDVNSVDRSKDESLIVTADDFGKVSLFNSPVVVENAPKNEASGHSSHVTNVRFLNGQDRVVSTGGHDYATFQWKVVKENNTSLVMASSSSSSPAAGAVSRRRSSGTSAAALVAAQRLRETTRRSIR